MSVDWKWQSQGGLLLDGNGDIASTLDERESLIDMVRTRVKASLQGWKLYAFGADLETLIGETVQPEIELAIRRQIQYALTRDFLPPGTFDIRTLAIGTTINAYIYLQEALLVKATISNLGNSPTVQV